MSQSAETVPTDLDWDLDLVPTAGPIGGRTVAASTPVRLKRAVSYLRVSSAKQVKTDYDPEGISLPAQRESCGRKAQQLGLDLVDEYVEPGVSGREMTKRVAFNAMLERIRRDRDVTHVVVYKLSRMNRNRIDDAFVMAELKALGVTLISATENIDETPEGQMLHGILATLNEYRSAADGADIKYKLAAKARKGGTISKAPLGYLNVGERIDDREIRTVIIDPERGPLVMQAFELCATDEYSMVELAEEMYERGLKTRRTSRHPAGPLSDQQMGRLLRDPYYIGLVTYADERFLGRHEPLITPQLFARVQAVLKPRTAAHERRRVHLHYLKGTLFCGRCEREGRHNRMIIARAMSKGNEYFYFFCRGRQERTCEAPYIPLREAEDAVQRMYESQRLEERWVAELRAGIRRTLASEQGNRASLRLSLDKQLSALKAKEANLIDLAAEGVLERAQIRDRMNDIQLERHRLEARRGDTGGELQGVLKFLDGAVLLLDEVHRLYAAVDDPNRRLLNQALFEMVLIEDEGEAEPRFKEPFGAIVGAERAEHSQRQPQKEESVAPAGAALEQVQQVRALLRVEVSSRDHLVGPVGLEPTTRGLKVRCSTD